MKKLKTLIGKTVLLSVFFCLLFCFVVFPYRMTGNNMFPSVKDGDFCLFLKVGSPHVGDVVLFVSAQGKKVGRIRAKGGQTVEFDEEDGCLIDGYVQAEELSFETLLPEETDIDFPLMLRDDEVFILNDYRPDIADSRMSGAVRREDVCGVLIFILRRRGF